MTVSTLASHSSHHHLHLAPLSPPHVSISSLSFLPSSPQHLSLSIYFLYFSFSFFLSVSFTSLLPSSLLPFKPVSSKFLPLPDFTISSPLLLSSLLLFLHLFTFISLLLFPSFLLSNLLSPFLFLFYLQVNCIFLFIALP